MHRVDLSVDVQAAPFVPSLCPASIAATRRSLLVSFSVSERVSRSRCSLRVARTGRPQEGERASAAGDRANVGLDDLSTPGRRWQGDASRIRVGTRRERRGFHNRSQSSAARKPRPPDLVLTHTFRDSCLTHLT